VNGGTIRKMKNTGYRMGLTGPKVIEQKFCLRTILSRKLDEHISILGSLILENQFRFAKT